MITIIKGEVKHTEAMHAIEAESFAAPWSALSIKYEIMHKYSVCIVAVDENDTVFGHAYMRHVINEGHIVNVAVQKPERNKGIGSRLVEGLIAAAHALEMIGLTLEVRRSNIAARILYEKHGFTEEGVRKNYYSHPTEDGIIMWKYF